jgi:hypothetical protein
LGAEPLFTPFEKVAYPPFFIIFLISMQKAIIIAINPLFKGGI